MFVQHGKMLRRRKRKSSVNDSTNQENDWMNMAAPLPKLSFGGWCFVQNQRGNHPKRWDRSENVVEIFQNESYGIKINGTCHITCQNRQFLHKFTPRLPVITYQPSATSSPTSWSIVYDVKASNPANQLQTASKMNKCSDNQSNVPSNTPSSVTEAYDYNLWPDIPWQQSRQHQPGIAPTDGLMCLPTETCIRLLIQQTNFKLHPRWTSVLTINPMCCQTHHRLSQRHMITTFGLIFCGNSLSNTYQALVQLTI